MPATVDQMRATWKRAAEKWIDKAIKDKGALHKHFGIPEGETIPTSKIKSELEKLKKKEGDKTEAEKKLTKQLNLALTLRSKDVPPPKGKKASGARLDSSLRRKINSELGKDKRTNGTFPNRKAQDGYYAAIEILGQYGIQIDTVINVFQFEGSWEGTVKVDLAFTNPDNPFNPEPINNSLLVVSYHPFGDTATSGDRAKAKFEVVAYLS